MPNFNNGFDMKEMQNAANDIINMLNARFNGSFCTKNKGGYILLLVNEELDEFHLISNYTPRSCPHCLDVYSTTINMLNEEIVKMKEASEGMN